PAPSLAPRRLINIWTEVSLPEDEKDRVRSALQEATLTDTSLASVAFHLGLASDGGRLANPAASMAEVTDPVVAEIAPSFDPSILIASVLAILAIVGLVVRAILTRPKLTREEHQRFADHLKRALETEPAS